MQTYKVELCGVRSLKARGKAQPVTMRMKSETIAEASEPSSLGSFASGSNDHCESGHNHIARVSDVALEGVDDDECADIEEGQVWRMSETKSLKDANKNY